MVKLPRIAVYIAGPLTTGDVEHNISTVLCAADTLLNRGLYVYVPHLTWHWHVQHPHDRSTWLDHDFEWLRRSDVLLRLGGTSPGADEEVAVAKSEGIPVYYSVDTLLARYGQWPRFQGNL